MTEVLKSYPGQPDTGPEREQHSLETVDNPHTLKPQGRAINLIHNPNIDILINNTSKLGTEWGSLISETWSNGRPSDWDISMSKYPHANLAIGTIDGKQFIGKKRLNRLQDEFTSDEIKQLHKITGEDTERPEVILSQQSKKAWYAFESLLNEINITPAVRDVIESADVQAYVHYSGFDGIRLVEPLVGVVDRQTNGKAEKYMIYEYISGAQTLAESESNGELPSGISNEIVDLLNNRFTQAGIIPSDLLPRQILIDNHQRLYLIDIEGYHKSA